MCGTGGRGLWHRQEEQGRQGKVRAEFISGLTDGPERRDPRQGGWDAAGMRGMRWGWSCGPCWVKEPGGVWSGPGGVSWGAGQVQEGPTCVGNAALGDSEAALGCP